MVTPIAGWRVLAIARNSPHLSGPVVRGLPRRIHARVVSVHVFRVRDGMLDGAQAVAAVPVTQTALDTQPLMASGKRYAARASRGVKARVCGLPAASAELRLACGGGPDPSGEFSLAAGFAVTGCPARGPGGRESSDYGGNWQATAVDACLPWSDDTRDGVPGCRVGLAGPRKAQRGVSAWERRCL